MAKYKLKPMILEAVSFNELIEYGMNHTDNIHNGMPWSFEFLGHSITHETDDCYLIAMTDGTTIPFTKNQMLLVRGNELDIMDRDQFILTCEPLEE